MTMALRPAVFLDRDDTLIRDKGYMHRKEDLVWLPGAIAAVRAINDAQHLAIVVTNQSGIGRGLFTEADMHAFHAAMQADLAAAGAHIDAFYFCPFHEDATIPAFRVADHPDRKPNPGMVLRAMAEHQVDPSRAVMIGNEQRDLDCAHRAGIRGLLTDGGDLAALVRRALAPGPA